LTHLSLSVGFPEHAVIFDVKTQWDSLFLMVEVPRAVGSLPGMLGSRGHWGNSIPCSYLARGVYLAVFGGEDGLRPKI